MADPTDVAAWVGAVSGVGSLFVAWRAHTVQKNAPVRADQRALRANVRSDAETVLERIELSERVARSGGSKQVDVGISAASPLDQWISRSDQFTNQAIPRVLRQGRYRLAKWEGAVWDYDSSLRYLEIAMDQESHLSTPESKEATLRFNRALTVATSDLLTESTAARKVVENILSTLTELDKKP